MKKITTIIILTAIFNTQLLSQQKEYSSRCDNIVSLAYNQFGCGVAEHTKNSLLMQAADCYRDSRKIDKAIKLAASLIHDINEQILESQGWIKKMVELQRIKHGPEYIKNQLLASDLKIEINEIFLNDFDISLVREFELENIIFVSIKIFGNEYQYISTEDFKKEDDQIINDFITSKIKKVKL